MQMFINSLLLLSLLLSLLLLLLLLLGSLISSVLIHFLSPFSCIRITTIFCQLLFNVFSRLVNNFINTILELPFNVDYIFVELILKNSVSFIRGLESGTLYQSQ